MTAGRPSKYSPNYCDLVIEEMSQGKSLTAFAAEIGVSRDTVSEWMSAHEEFSVSVKVGKSKCAAWWEQVGRNIAQNGAPGPGASTLVVFGLRNMARDDWQERQEIDHKVTTVVALPPVAETTADWLKESGE